MSDTLLVGGRRPFAPWLIEPMRRNQATYSKVALAAVMVNLFGLASAMFSMTVYDRVIPNNAMSSLVALSIGLAIIVIFDFILRTLRAYFVDIAGANIDQDVGEDVFGRLLALRLDQRRGSTGTLTGVMRELETLRDFFASATMTAMVDVPFILLTLAVIAIVGGPVVFVPLAMIPLVIIAGWLTHPAMDRLATRTMGESLAKQSVLVEAVGGLEMVKAANAGPLLARRWADAIKHHADSSLRQRLISTIAVNVSTSANTISYAGVVIVGATMIADHTLTTGGLIACSILSGRAVAPLAQIAQLLSRLTATRTAYQQVNALMSVPPEGPEGEAIRPRQIAGRIEFRNVDFRYPGASEKALAGVSFTIEPGEHVALLGRVGSGKSTVARLMIGLYPPEDGLVMIDGTDVRQFDPQALRRQVGTVLQDNVLLSGTVRENIALDREAVDQEEMLRVANISGTHAFMGQVANGYDLKLADRGEGLSGGQRQSIAIARALAGSPPVMVLDEPSSAMDNQTEAALLDRLMTEFEGRTLILITHRPALLRLTQRVMVFEKGRLAADGPREAILNRLTGVKAA